MAGGRPFLFTCLHNIRPGTLLNILRDTSRTVDGLRRLRVPGDAHAHGLGQPLSLTAATHGDRGGGCRVADAESSPLGEVPIAAARHSSVSPAGPSRAARGLHGQHLLARELLVRGQVRPAAFGGRLRVHRGCHGQSRSPDLKGVCLWLSDRYSSSSWGSDHPDFHGEIIKELERLARATRCGSSTRWPFTRTQDGELEVEHLSNLSETGGDRARQQGRRADWARHRWPRRARRPVRPRGTQAEAEGI